ncbi:hypothetical protein AgCh_018240 [Apium graveolens]
MEYVKDNLGYSEIGGIYVKKQSGGWKLIATDAEAISLGEGMKNGYFLYLYVDTVVNKAIEPASQAQPHVIPYSKKDKVVNELSRFLGKIERLDIPLDFVSWSRVSEEEKNGLREYLKTKYIIPEEGKNWVLKMLDDNWRVYKSRVKSRCFKKFDNDRDRIKSKPANIPLEQFMVMLKYWSDEAVQDKDENNIANRKKVTDTHTVGHTSFTQLRNKMANPNEELADDDNEKMAELDFEAHGPNWLLGRSGRTRKSNKKLEKTGHIDSADVEKMREEIAAEMDDKLNKKLKKILGRLAEMNPAINVNVDELCAESSVEADASDDDEKDRDDDDGDEGGGDESDEDGAEIDSDGGDESA